MMRRTNKHNGSLQQVRWEPPWTSLSSAPVRAITLHSVIKQITGNACRKVWRKSIQQHTQKHWLRSQIIIHTPIVFPRGLQHQCCCPPDIVNQHRRLRPLNIRNYIKSERLYYIIIIYYKLFNHKNEINVILKHSLQY